MTDPYCCRTQTSEHEPNSLAILRHWTSPRQDRTAQRVTMKQVSDEEVSVIHPSVEETPGPAMSWLGIGSPGCPQDLSECFQVGLYYR